MDTDDLSREAYIGILAEAENLTHDLTLHFGVLSYSCETEADYIQNAKELTKDIMKMKNHELDDFFWGSPPDKNMLIETCKKILDNISKVESIPITKRQYDF
jgi:hypothetical protein